MSDTHDRPTPSTDAPERESAESLPTSESEVVTNRSLARVCWLITTTACLIAALIVLIRGDTGYAAVTFAVAVAAAINLF